MEQKTAVRTLYHCVYNLNYHLVLVTKYRRKCITAPMLMRLKEHCTALVEKWECELLEFNGEPDQYTTRNTCRVSQNAVKDGETARQVIKGAFLPSAQLNDGRQSTLSGLSSKFHIWPEFVS